MIRKILTRYNKAQCHMMYHRMQNSHVRCIDVYNNIIANNNDYVCAL